jgi:hypothetical protein
MCMPDGDKATKRAEQAEAQRQSQISGNVQSINRAFAGREPQYAQFTQALRERLNTQFGQQRQAATRQNKFALAKSGLTGGSAAIDAGRRLTREGQEGALQVERTAQGAGADLRAKDENARNQMIALAQSGTNIGNAGQQTAQMLQANIGSAQNQDLTNRLGDVFGGTAQAYRTAVDAKERRRGLDTANLYARAFTR